LASSVAVNPFLGQTNESLAKASARLARVAGVQIIMPRSWYQERIASSAITDEDLSAALASSAITPRPTGLTELKAAARGTTPKAKAIPTIAELATETSGDRLVRLHRRSLWRLGRRVF